MNEKRNKRFMQIIRNVHGLFENDDINKNRHSQDHLGSILSHDKHYEFISDSVNNIHCEWTKYNHSLSSESNDIIFYCHGGGYMTGSCLYARGITTKLSKYTSCNVFCFDYRLTPEHPYPAAVQDALVAWNYILSKGYQPNNIIIAGDSAGGNLALTLTMHLRDSHYSLPKCLILFSPWTDLTASGDSFNTKAELDPVLNTAYITRVTKYYLNGQNPTSPYISPLFGSFTSFPPVYIHVGENEILQDDSTRLYKILLFNNVYAKLDIYSGMWHVFQLAPIKQAKESIIKTAQFITEVSHND